MSEVATETEAATPPLEEVGSWRVLVRNFSTLAVGEVFARLAGLGTVLLLAWRLGPVGFGIVTLGLTLVGWFVLRPSLLSLVLKQRLPVYLAARRHAARARRLVRSDHAVPARP